MRGKNKDSIDQVRLDVILIVLIGVSVLLFISTIGLCGLVGEGISYLLFGLIGTAGYVFPFILFFINIYIFIKREKYVRKLVGISGLFLFSCGFLQAVMVGYEQGYSIIRSFTDSAADHLGGGLIGGIIVQLLGSLIGIVGTYVVLILGIFIFAIILTQKPLVSAMRNNTAKVYNKARQTRRIRLEETKSLKDTIDEITDETQPDRDGHKNGKATTLKPEGLKKKEEEHEDFIIDSEDDDIGVSAQTSGSYVLPPLSLLQKGKSAGAKELTDQARLTAKKLQETLLSFGVDAKVTNASCGPTVTRYELQPQQGVKVSRIVSLADDIKLNLAAADIRIEAPIPGKAAIGIEVPNKSNNSVLLRELLDTAEFKNSKSKLSFAVGKDLSGRPVVTDIGKMPHLLIAGATGSGKSVCLNTLIVSILYKASPDEVKFIMIDPKVVELSIYNGIPHLLSPVVTDPKKAAGALAWAVAEMTRRYNLFAELGVRDLVGYNLKAQGLAHFASEDEEAPEMLSQIVIVVDELADLMMVAPGEVEDCICRLAQLARAAGLHLIIATQRPSVNVITGLIKANMPSRIALSVTSGIDSRVILDMNGAEKLLGKGDMLFYPAGYPKPARIQGGFVSDTEIQKVVDFISKGKREYDPSVEEAINSSASARVDSDNRMDERDSYFADAGRFIIEKDKASIGLLQRMFKIGFNRAARIMDQLHEAGVVGEEEGTKPRKILMNAEQFESFIREDDNG